MRRRVLVRWTALTAAVALHVFAPPAAGGVARAEHGPIHYAALGDSYPGGTGAGKYDPSSGRCKRSPEAYPALWARESHVSSFDFRACFGATTDSVRNQQLGGLNRETNVVSVSVGGNDAGFVPVLTKCALGSDAECDAAVTRAEGFVNSALPSKLDSTYRAISAAAPNARVTVVGYPRLFEMTGSCGLIQFSEAKRARLNEAGDRLNDVIGGRAAAAGLRYVDARNAFAGHGACGAQPWLNNPRLPIQESFHPNATGHAEGYLPAVGPVLSESVASRATTH